MKQGAAEAMVNQQNTSQTEQPPTRTDAPLFERHLKPHRSLSNSGFAGTILFTACAFLLPLLAFLGTFALWTLLPFLAAAVAALWYFIRRNDKDGELCEHIRIWPDLIFVHRTNPRAADQTWQANPYWVSAQTKNTPKIEHYLTLKGAGREIELGAFLTASERQTLYRDLLGALAKARK